MCTRSLRILKLAPHLDGRFRQLASLLACLLISSWANLLVAQAASPLAKQERVDSSDQSANPVDFRTQILPILETRCFKCHCATRSDGDLRLDSAQAAGRGGHTGGVILAATAADSELYRRLISEQPDYRMPKRGEALPANEIELIRRWIDQGASYDGFSANSEAESGQEQANRANANSGSSGGSKASKREFSVDGLGGYLFDLNVELAKPRFHYWPTFAWLFVAWAMVFLLKALGSFFKTVRTFKVTRKTNMPADASGVRQPREIQDPLGRLGRWISWSRLAVVFCGLAIGGFIAYQAGLIAELSSQAKTAGPIGRVQPEKVISLDRTNLTMPTFPLHPPRLGGTYYRGNDERDPSLFNNGFYRTAKLEVWLVDQTGKRLAWQDTVEDHPLSIKFIIERSPGTTPALFDEKMMQTIYLRRFRETELVPANEVDESMEVYLTVVEPDLKWEATVPLETTSTWGAATNQGVIYIFFGPKNAEGMQGRIHYGIRYELEQVEGKIAESSQLWMGSMYDLGGRVLIPQEGEILLDHWFDFRPIPEIEGENSQDPTLLGIPEHVR